MEKVKLFHVSSDINNGVFHDRDTLCTDSKQNKTKKNNKEKQTNKQTKSTKPVLVVCLVRLKK